MRRNQLPLRKYLIFATESASSQKISYFCGRINFLSENILFLQRNQLPLRKYLIFAAESASSQKISYFCHGISFLLENILFLRRNQLPLRKYLIFAAESASSQKKTIYYSRLYGRHVYLVILKRAISSYFSPWVAPEGKLFLIRIYWCSEGHEES